VRLRARAEHLLETVVGAAAVGAAGRAGTLGREAMVVRGQLVVLLEPEAGEGAIPSVLNYAHASLLLTRKAAVEAVSEF
jgi:hypothetical protein